jgi:23S rRNA (uracil1939-C5)-methyltransferase
MTDGSPDVGDPLRTVTDGVVAEGAIRRHAESFFQGNRFLLAALVKAVADVVPGEGEILDLYAGVGLFSVPLAAMGHLEVTAVEGDRAGGADLRENGRAHEPRLKTYISGVEEFLAERRRTPAAMIVDPPRTGLSKAWSGSCVSRRVRRLRVVRPADARPRPRRLLDAATD